MVSARVTARVLRWCRVFIGFMGTRVEVTVVAVVPVLVVVGECGGLGGMGRNAEVVTYE